MMVGLLTKHADQLRSRSSSTTTDVDVTSQVPEEDDLTLAPLTSVETTPVAREATRTATFEAGETPAVPPPRQDLPPNISESTPVVPDDESANSGGVETGVTLPEQNSPEPPESPDPPETRRSGRSCSHPNRYGDFQ